MLGDFIEFCGNLRKCLRIAEKSLYGGLGELEYRITNLRNGSALLEIEPVVRRQGGDKRASVVRQVKSTVNSIQQGKRPRTALTQREYEAYKKLALPVGRSIKEMVVGDTAITSHFVEHIERFMSESIPTTGSVAGLLEKVDIHGKNHEFVLFPPIPGHSVRCQFTDSLLSKVKTAIGNTVTVTGKLEYEQDRPFPHLVHAISMEIHPRKEELPTLLELRGFAKGSTGDLSAVEYVRSLRNE